ncbi:MAG: sugar phosphate isomerase/epimerase [Syntrophorhabdaceae bacterium]|nr:sugar phosphate isomerase/epimerase [Syntrophorhabdales bacterium]MBP9561146.1 sugar phosphate isomerase/epimerase [Syntrophorhabdaceae bacterium]
MKVLFSTGCIYYLPIKEIFILAKEAGFDGCDLVINRHFNRPDYLDIVKGCCQILPVYSIHAPFLKIDAWGSKTNAIVQTVRIAQALNAGIINFHPPSWFSAELLFFRSFRKIEDFQKSLGSEGIRLTIENMPLVGKKLMLTPYILNDFKDLIEYGLKRNLDFTFDTTHLGTFGIDPVVGFLSFFRTERLKNIHISDYNDTESHLFLGRGDMPVARFLNTLRRLNYDGMITLEVSPEELPRTREWMIKMMRYQLSLLRFHLGLDVHG